MIAEPSKRIESLYAFLAVGRDGRERPCVVKDGAGKSFPLVVGDLEGVAECREFAQMIATKDKLFVRLVHYTVRAELELISP